MFAYTWRWMDSACDWRNECLETYDPWTTTDFHLDVAIAVRRCLNRKDMPQTVMVTSMRVATFYWTITPHVPFAYLRAIRENVFEFYWSPFVISFCFATVLPFVIALLVDLFVQQRNWSRHLWSLTSGPIQVRMNHRNSLYPQLNHPNPFVQIACSALTIQTDCNPSLDHLKLTPSRAFELGSKELEPG